MPDYVTFNILTPFPGCQYYEVAKEQGYVNDNMDWSKIDWDRATLPTRYLSKEEVDKEYKRLKKKFSYLCRKRSFNPRYIFIRGITELRNISIQEWKFSLFEFWIYLKSSLFKAFLKRQ